MIECKTDAFSDTEKVEFFRECLNYTSEVGIVGKVDEVGHRSLTATMLWKFCSHLQFLELVR